MKRLDGEFSFVKPDAIKGEHIAPRELLRPDDADKTFREQTIRKGNIPTGAAVEVEQLVIRRRAAELLAAEIAEFRSVYDEWYKAERTKMAEQCHDYERGIDEMLSDISMIKRWLSEALVNAAHDAKCVEYLEEQIEVLKISLEYHEKTLAELLAHQANATLEENEMSDVSTQRNSQLARAIHEIRNALGETSTPPREPREFTFDLNQTEDVPAVEETRYDASVRPKYHQVATTDLTDEEERIARTKYPLLLAKYEEILGLCKEADFEYGQLKSRSEKQIESIGKHQDEISAIRKKLEKLREAHESATGDFARHAERFELLPEQLEHLDVMDEVKVKFERQTPHFVPTRAVIPPTWRIQSWYTGTTAEHMQQQYDYVAGVFSRDDLRSVPENLQRSRHFDTVVELYAHTVEIEETLEELKRWVIDTTDANLSNLEVEHSPSLLRLDRHRAQLADPDQVPAIFTNKAIEYDTASREHTRQLASHLELDTSLQHALDMIRLVNQRIAYNNAKLAQLKAVKKRLYEQQVGRITEYQVNGEINNDILIEQASAGDTEAINQILGESCGGHIGYTYVEPTDDEYLKLKADITSVETSIQDTHDDNGLAGAENTRLSTICAGLRREISVIENALLALEAEMKAMITDEEHVRAVATFEAAKRSLGKDQTKFYQLNPEYLPPEPPQHEIIVVPAPSFADAYIPRGVDIKMPAQTPHPKDRWGKGVIAALRKLQGAEG